LEYGVRLLAIVLSLHFFEPCSAWSADPQKLEKLVIGYQAPVASLGILDVMRKSGLFKKNGLNVDLVYIKGSEIVSQCMRRMMLC